MCVVKRDTVPTTVQKPEAVGTVGRGIIKRYVEWIKEWIMLLYDFKELNNYVSTLPATKRSILKLSDKVFDPLGFVSPFIVKVKILLQELCADKSSRGKVPLSTSCKFFRTFVFQDVTFRSHQ